MLADSLPILLSVVFTILAVGALFFYIKQRLAIIEHSQMEQAKVLQSFITSMHQKNQILQHQYQVNKQFDKDEKNEHDSSYCTRDGCFPHTKQDKIDVSDEEYEEEEDETESESGSESGSESECDEEQEYKIKEIHLTNNIDDINHELKNNDPNIKVIEIKNSNLESDDNEDDDSKTVTSECSSISGTSEESDENQEIQEIHLDENNEKEVKNLHIEATEDEETKYKNMSVAALRNLVKSKNNKEVNMSDSAINKLNKKELIKLLI